MPSRCAKTTALGLRCRKSCWSKRQWFKPVVPMVVFITAVTMILTLDPEKDPRIQALNTTLDIPEHGHYTYICLHHEDWSECIQFNLKHHGTFNITVERTTSEVFHDFQLWTTVGIAILVLLALLVLLAKWIALFQLVLLAKWIALSPLVRKCICPSTTTTCGPQNDDVAIDVIVNPPPQSRKDGNSCAVNITSQIDSSFDAGTEFLGAVGGHVKELEEKIKASSDSLKAPLKPRMYDCFIIYSRDDEDVVYNKLIPFFIRNNIKYCEHQEHFELGKNIFDNVNTCISYSRRVVAVLSKSFFDSGYCMMDLDAARGYAARNGYSVQDFLISIKITDFVFPNKYSDISNSTYADLSEDVNDERKWLQIRKALTEFRLASVIMRIEMGSKYCTPKSRLAVLDTNMTETEI